MPAATFGISIDDQAVRRMLARAPAETSLALRQGIEASAIDVQREMIIAANVGATGDLRRSIRYVVSPYKFEATIGPNRTYAEAVERGTRAHWVSVAEGSSLAAWARLKGINKYALQRSIARKGTKAHPYVEPTFIKMRPQVIRDVSMAMARVVQELNRG